MSPILGKFQMRSRFPHHNRISRILLGLENSAQYLITKLRRDAFVIIMIARLCSHFAVERLRCRVRYISTTSSALDLNVENAS